MEFKTTPVPEHDKLREQILATGMTDGTAIVWALTTVGADVRIAADPAALAGADALIVPGVGAAAPAMDRLGRHRLIDPIRAWLAAGRPFLGICLGLQLLFEASDEDGAITLGVLPGRTCRLADAPTLPHIGWNQVERTHAHPSTLGPDQQNARRLGPGHAVTDGDEVVVWVEVDDLSLHAR